MGIKHSMERFIKKIKINKEGNSKREFTDLNASGRSLILQSVHLSQGALITLMHI